MSKIYAPKGRAAEYSPLALNLFMGCSHDCEYCFARRMGKRRSKDYVHTDVHLQKVTHQSLRRDCINHAGEQRQVLMSFSTDPYMHAFDTSFTTYALEQFLESQIPAAILTKAPSNAARDFKLMQKFGESLIMGTTITTMRNYQTVEPFADPPLLRIISLAKAKQHGLTTWISMEPAFSIAEGLEIIEQTYGVIDRYRLGKLNYKKLAIDWTEYVIQTVELLRSLGKSIFVKSDLAKFAPAGFLTADELNPRLQDAKPFLSR
jgi:DNA repair photolyase